MNVKVFDMWDVAQAISWAGQAHGNVAVHLHTICGPHAPACFKKALGRGEKIAHVFCQDAALALDIAYRVGALRARIERPGKAGQHVDLCGRPLDRLLALANGAPA